MRPGEIYYAELGPIGFDLMLKIEKALRIHLDL